MTGAEVGAAEIVAALEDLWYVLMALNVGIWLIGGLMIGRR